MARYNQVSSAAASASLLAKPVKARVLHLAGYNAKATAQFIQLIDAVAVPSDLVVGVAEVFTVDFTAKAPVDLGDKYLTTEDATGAVYVWFNLDAAGTDPAPEAGGRAIEVAIATGDTAAQLAGKFAAAVDADASFVSGAVAELATVTQAATGARTNATAGDSTLTVATTVAGVTAIAAAVPLAVVVAAGTSNFQIPLPDGGLECESGVVVCNSSTYATKTAGSADCFFTVQTT